MQRGYQRFFVKAAGDFRPVIGLIAYAQRALGDRQVKSDGAVKAERFGIFFKSVFFQPVDTNFAEYRINRIGKGVRKRNVIGIFVVYGFELGFVKRVLFSVIRHRRTGLESAFLNGGPGGDDFKQTGGGKIGARAYVGVPAGSIKAYHGKDLSRRLIHGHEPEILGVLPVDIVLYGLLQRRDNAVSM